MSLADDIAAVLPQMRAEAESRMLDACLITRPGADPVWDDATGSYLPAAPVTVYAGKCRLRNANPAPQNADAGEAAWAVDQVVLSLPLDGTAAVTDGCTATITACLNDPGMVGLVLTVQAGHFQTDSTARRVPCQVVSRDV